MTDIRKQTAYKLVVPITIEGREITTVTLRRLKGKDIREMEKHSSDLDKTFCIIGRLASADGTGLPPEALDEMDAADFEAISEIVEGFMGRRERR